MITVKLLCSILIIVCSSVLGIQAANRYVLRVKEIRMLQMAFTQLESEILNYSTFLPEAVEKATVSVQGGIKEFFCEFAHRLQDRSGDHLPKSYPSPLSFLRIVLLFSISL